MPLNRLFLLLLYLIPIVDVLLGVGAKFSGLYSGYEMGQKMLTLIPSMLLRILILIISLTIIKYLKKDLKIFYIFLMIIFLFLSEFISVIYFSSSVEYFILGLIEIYKPVLIFVVVLYLLRNKELKYDVIVAISFALKVYSLAIIIGYLSGYDYKTYGGLGSSGFLISGSANSASLLFLIASTAFSYLFLEKKVKALNYYVFMSLCLYAMYLMMTKTGFVGVSLIFSFSIYRYMVKNYKIIGYGIVSFILCLMVIYGYHLSSLSIYQRFLNVVEYFDGNILYALSSGRLIFLDYAIENIYNHMDILNFLFGFGHQSFRDLMIGLGGHPQGVEIDFFDLFFKYGLFGLILVFSPYLLVLFLSFKNIFKSKNYSIFYFSYIIVFLSSFTTGHVFTSGLAGYALSILIFIVITKNETTTNI